MTDNENKLNDAEIINDSAKADEQSTIFVDPTDTDSPRKSKKKKKQSSVKKQRIAIIAAVVLIAIVLAGFFIGSAIHNKHVELGAKWDAFKIAMEESLSDKQRANLAKYDTFADWLAEHHNDADVRMLIKENKTVKKILDDSPALNDLVKSIAKQKDFANRIDALSEDPAPAVKLIDGEVLGTGNRIYMYTPYSRSDISTVEVKNEYGGYKFYHDEEADEFFVEGHKEAPFSPELFSSLIVSTGKPNVIERVFDKCENFAEYGLADGKSSVSYTVTAKDGTSHTVYIGDMTLSGEGYYAKHADRDALYVLGAALESTVLSTLENMITPQLVLPMSEGDNFTIRNFAILDKENVKVMLTFLDNDKRDEYGMESSFYMIHPGAYSVNSTNYAEIVTTLTNFTGLYTVKYDPEPEDLEKYGVSSEKYAYHVRYEYNGILQEIFFSEKNENGNYYAVSPLFNLIAEVDGASAAWLEWDLIRFVDDPIFMMNINEMETITVKSPTAERIFDLTGTDQELKIVERNTKIEPEVENFRYFYRVLLSTNLQGYASSDLSEDELAALREGEPDLTLTVKTRADKTIVYRFYKYKTLRAYYTVDNLEDNAEPKGQFYVMSASVAKIISDAERVLKGEAVDYSTQK